MTYPKDSISIDEINAASFASSHKYGYCMCIRGGLEELINFDGFTCSMCSQIYNYEKAHSPEAKQIRSKAVRDAYPEKNWN